jgi:hypothetical protein
MLNQIELERQREYAKGIRYSILGGGIMAFNLFNFIFSLPFKSGRPSGFWLFISLILLAVGVSKIISHRSHPVIPGQAQIDPHQQSTQHAPPHPVFSPTSSNESSTPQTSGLEMGRQPAPSVTEDDTQHLPHYAPLREVQK